MDERQGIMDPVLEDCRRAVAVMEEARELGIVGCDHEGPCLQPWDTEAELEHYPVMVPYWGAAMFSKTVREDWRGWAPGDPVRAGIISNIARAASDLAGLEYHHASGYVQHALRWAQSELREVADSLQEASIDARRHFEREMNGGRTVDELLKARDLPGDPGAVRDLLREQREAAAEAWERHAQEAAETAARLREGLTEPEQAPAA
jgi:hypothetical protein